MLHMGDYLGIPGNSSGWKAGNAEATGSLTDLSPHVDGGSATGATGTNAATDRTNLHYAAGIVIVAGLLLWFFGAIVFKSVRL